LSRWLSIGALWLFWLDGEKRKPLILLMWIEGLPPLLTNNKCQRDNATHKHWDFPMDDCAATIKHASTATIIHTSYGGTLIPATAVVKPAAASGGGLKGQALQWPWPE
jgi:hypothetical protein